MMLDFCIIVSAICWLYIVIIETKKNNKKGD